MDNYIVYYDETGDDGVNTSSSESFILTCIYMNSDKWQENFLKIQNCRKQMKLKYGFHVSEEFHTKHLITDKKPFSKYEWSEDQRKQILVDFAKCIADLDIQIINVIIDKTKIDPKIDPNYHVLENALKYSIQRIENDCKGQWNYLIIADQGRIAPMRRTARAIRAYNPIPPTYQNTPIKKLIEDILEKDSKESYFIQVCDCISYMVHLFYKTQHKKQTLPNRVSRVIDEIFVCRFMATIQPRINLKASYNNYGLVIYPK